MELCFQFISSNIIIQYKNQQPFFPDVSDHFSKCPQKNTFACCSCPLHLKLTSGDRSHTIFVGVRTRTASTPTLMGRQKLTPFGPCARLAVRPGLQSLVLIGAQRQLPRHTLRLQECQPSAYGTSYPLRTGSAAKCPGGQAALLSLYIPFLVPVRHNYGAQLGRLCQANQVTLGKKSSLRINFAKKTKIVIKVILIKIINKKLFDFK